MIFSQRGRDRDIYFDFCEDLNLTFKSKTGMRSRRHFLRQTFPKTDISQLDLDRKR